MEDKMTKIIWDLFLKLRAVSANTYADVVTLLFIKYVAKYPDEFIPYIKDADSIKTIMEFSRKYDAARTGNDYLTKEDLESILSGIDEGALSIGSDVKLHDIAANIPYFFDKQTQMMIINALDEIAIDSNPENWKKLLEQILTASQGLAGICDETITPVSLRNVAYRLLNVADDEKLLNCYCGYSSLLLGDIKPSKYIGYDTNRSATLISLITAILLKVRLSINNKDFLYAHTEQTADKVFVDAPFGLKRDIPYLREKYQINTKDADVLTIYKAIESIKDNGLAVCVVPGKVLFSQSKTGETLRSMLLNNGLKEVIMLPSLWNRTNLNANLLLIEKSYEGNVMFVKADNLGFKDKRSTVLSQEDIEKIIQATSNEIEGMSLMVDKQTIVKEATLMPTAYITNVSRKVSRSVDVIDEELRGLYKVLYSDLENNIKRLNK